MTNVGGDKNKSRITRLHKVAAELQAATEHDEVYDTVIEAAVEILGFDWCAVGVPDDGWLCAQSVSEAGPLEKDERLLRTDEGVAGKTYQEQKSVILVDGEEHDTAKPVYDRITSGLSVPLGKWGIFQGIAEERAVFESEDREAAELLASHATAALNRIEHEQTLQKKNDRLEKFASVVSHDLRSPLTVAELRLEMLRQECDSEYIDDIDQALDRMDQLLENLLSLARAGEAVRDPEPVELARVAKNCWETLESGRDTLTVDADLILLADAIQVRQLLENLLKNAMEHGSNAPEEEHQDDNTAVRITIGTLDNGFYIADDGTGIPPEKRDDVFESGYSTDTDGTGFGLSIVMDIVEAHGWDIAVTESVDGGARFEITGVDTD
ncbi:GAF domain-containing sensor histidine kinase [Halovenus rubra]|uniref:GAF domain-containing sensor histidine kinase n=2 Tax=Halovenus rubra TaxID=869890 RepID=A0ACC7DY06_9EURY|nr:GAF domain-containing sensor histidine kinase [Halovenus rubra]